MKLPALVLLVAAPALLVSLRAFGSSDGDAADRTHTTYYPSGRVETEYEVQDGHREGAFRRFYADGSRMAEGRYAGGKMDGEWTFWRPDGTVDPERSGLYEAGDRRGTPAAR